MQAGVPRGGVCRMSTYTANRKQTQLVTSTVTDVATAVTTGSPRASQSAGVGAPVRPRVAVWAMSATATMLTWPHSALIMQSESCSKSSAPLLLHALRFSNPPLL